MHNDFTLFSRVVPSGKTVVYYYAYDQEGKRLGPWTTGQANKTAARNYCNLLNRKGKLLQGLKDIPTFEEFAADFWDWNNSPYLKDRKKRRELTQHYADKNKRVVENALLPYFGKKKLDTITGEVIDHWLDYMIKKGYLNSTTNTYFTTLQTMMKWAVKKGLVARDPFLDVQKLINNRKETKIITHDEFKALFVDDWEKVWEKDLLRCTAHKLAALTGIRCSEVLGLRGEYVFNDHIYLCAQFDEYGYRDTKNKLKHNIPLAAEMIRDLRSLMKLNGQGYIFSLDGGATPVCRQHLYRGLQKAFNNIGITKKEIKERGLNIHAWRHFCNTELQKGGLSVKQVQAVIGHKTEDMTERYTHFDPIEFGEVPKIQETLLQKKNDTLTSERPSLTLVKINEDTQSIKRKQAS